jgi:hypothetical protein
MLQVSASIGTKIANKIIAPFVLIKFDFTAGAIFVTNAPRNIDYNGDIYLADGGLVSVSPPKAQAEISRDLFVIKVTDADSSWRTELDAENIGVPVTVLTGFADITTGEIDGEYLDTYIGKISHVGSEISEDEPFVEIQCSGPLTKLHQITNRTTTESSQKRRYPADTCMDYAFDTEDSKTRKWGGTS